jgi:hypothetical protein
VIHTVSLDDGTELDAAAIAADAIAAWDEILTKLEISPDP